MPIESKPIPVGTLAPDFTLPSANGDEVSLSLNPVKATYDKTRLKGELQWRERFLKNAIT